RSLPPLRTARHSRARTGVGHVVVTTRSRSMHSRSIGLSLLLALSLTACGSTQEDRGLSGAGIGAAAGAVVGAVTGLTIVEGVIIGAAAGGATGLLTDKSQVNLGDPVWKKGDKAQASAGSDTVRGIQSGLGKLGYDAGPADGRSGPKTSA